MQKGEGEEFISRLKQSAKIGKERHKELLTKGYVYIDGQYHAPANKTHEQILDDLKSQ
jgi:hypothetical protein